MSELETSPPLCYSLKKALRFILRGGAMQAGRRQTRSFSMKLFAILFFILLTSTSLQAKTYKDTPYGDYEDPYGDYENPYGDYEDPYGEYENPYGDY